MQSKNYRAVITAVAFMVFSLSTSAQANAQTNVQIIDAQNAAASPLWIPAKPATVKAVKNSIVAQLEAFKRDDYSKADAYQSSLLRANFPSDDQFRQMMKSEYPEFASYKSAVFGPVVTTNNNKVVQVPVKVTGTDGLDVAAIYLMIFENGIYRVAGVEGGSSPHPITLPTDPAVT